MRSWRARPWSCRAIPLLRAWVVMKSSPSPEAAGFLSHQLIFSAQAPITVDVTSMRSSSDQSKEAAQSWISTSQTMSHISLSSLQSAQPRVFGCSNGKQANNTEAGGSEMAFKACDRFRPSGERAGKEKQPCLVPACSGLLPFPCACVLNT